MANIANASQLAPAATQFPVEWYFDEQLFAHELRLLFTQGAGYLGHERMVPECYDYRSFEWQDHGRILTRQPDAVYAMSNVCRHRQAIMLQGSGNAKYIVCPVHRWTYGADGSQRGAPHFPENPCLNLERQALESWQGLLFEGPRSAKRDLAGMQLAADFDFTGFRLDRVELHNCNYNWKTFIEVYLEDYHVAPAHPGLGKFVSCDDLTWQFGDWYSVQRVGLSSLAKAGSSAYGRWQDALKARAVATGTAPRHGALWLTYYPNVMVEWYPQVLVVSSLIPQAVDRTLNVVEFYYPDDVVAFEREFIEAQQMAYMETAIEDDDIAERMDRGRRALMKRGRNETGPYQSPMEDGMQHFHEFYRRMMAAHV